ncbi:MAG TPA: PsiF family protein [Burkholderiales bacterium]|jgi:hypothetical protein|nr:PsiF family protein [Burkholderiales bacterium]
MKNLVLLLGLVLTCAPVFAQNTSQQDKMKACNADAAKKELKGDERKVFMKECLSVKKVAKEENEEAREQKKDVKLQRERMKSCNADASRQVLKGDARRIFMSDCLKKKA